MRIFWWLQTVMFLLIMFPDEAVFLEALEWHDVGRGGGRPSEETVDAMII